MPSAVQPKELQARGRSTQDRMQNDGRRFGRAEPQICQRRNWLLHRRPNTFETRTREVHADVTHAIAALEYSDVKMRLQLEIVCHVIT